MTQPLDPHKIIVVIKDSTDAEVGRIPATAPNASAYIDATVRAHPPKCTVDYEQDENASLLAMLHSRR